MNSPSPQHFDQKQQEQLVRQLDEDREGNLQKVIEHTEGERIKKKGLKVLRTCGIYEAHQDLMKTLFNFGMPKENIYEYSAMHLAKYQKKL